MIDLQDNRLDKDVFLLKAKLLEMARANDAPRFETKQLENGKWECKLKVPGVKKMAATVQRTEVEAINMCATIMLHILKSTDEYEYYDPDYPECFIADEISEIFGDTEFDKQYRYSICGTEILIENENKSVKEVVEKGLKKLLHAMHESNIIAERMDARICVRFLTKEKKKYIN